MNHEVLISILSNYLPDIGDLLLLIITILSGMITVYPKQQVSKIEKMSLKNSEDHEKMWKGISAIDTWTKAIHETQIEPTLRKANANEEKILRIEPKIEDHERRIIVIEKKVK